jgi:hypothetical protein
MDNIFNCKRLFYNNEIFYYFKDILRHLSYIHDKQLSFEYLDLLKENEQFTIEELEKKYKKSGFKSYIKEDQNKMVIESLTDSGPHLFISQSGVKKLMSTSTKSVYDNILNTFKEMNIEEEFMNERPNIINCLSKIFKYENFKLQHSIKGYIVDIYFIDYNLAIKRSSSHIKNKRRIEKDIGCSIITYNPNIGEFNLFEFVEKIAKFMENCNIEKYNNCYYYLQN